MKISLKKQMFGGHKEALSLEINEPIQLNKSIGMKMVSINTGSGNERVEQMERVIKQVGDSSALRDDNKVSVYIIKEKTKIFFEVRKKSITLI